MLDVDNDGDLEIYVCNYDGPNLLYGNNGQGKLRPAATSYGLNVIDA